MPIYNQIFEHYRNEQARIDKAIKLLKDKGFYIKDLKNETNRKVYSDSSDKGRG